LEADGELIVEVQHVPATHPKQPFELELVRAGQISPGQRLVMSLSKPKTAAHDQQQ
jgi:hypothetical protein